MACKRCGQCCMFACVIMEGLKVAEDKMELGRWFEEHHCKVIPVQRDEGTVLGLRIPLICRNLEIDTSSGTAHCMIYETRPQICRDHICEAARGGS